MGLLISSQLSPRNWLPKLATMLREGARGEITSLYFEIFKPRSVQVVSRAQPGAEVAAGILIEARRVVYGLVVYSTTNDS